MTAYDDTVHGPVPTPAEQWGSLARTPSTTLHVKRLHPDAVIPRYQTSGAACFDLHAIEGGIIQPFGHLTLRTGLALGIAQGWRVDVYSRSGMGFNHGIRLANGTGKVDQDYTGEVMVCLHNDRDIAVVINKGDRIAQAEVNPAYRAEFIEVNELTNTERGEGGFGSTGR